MHNKICARCIFLIKYCKSFFGYEKIIIKTKSELAKLNKSNTHRLKSYPEEVTEK